MDYRTERASGLGVLGGVAVGTVIVLASILSLPPPVHLVIGPASSSDYAGLSCSPGMCVNVTVGFTGPKTIDPTVLRVEVVPMSPSEVINGSSGRHLNLTYFPDAIPHWIGNLGNGSLTEVFEAEMVNPGGQLVGTGGAGAIADGATFCLKSTATNTTVEYTLSFSYQRSSASIPFAIE